MYTWAGLKEGVFTVGDLTGGKVKPPPPLFGDLILDNTLTLITAPPYTGKSLLIASMILSLDSGLPLFGKYAPAQGKSVLAFLQDAVTWDYAGQLCKLARGYNLTQEQAELMDAKLVINRGTQITDPDFLTNLDAEYNERPFNVLFLDAFWTIHSFNENDNSQMGYVMRVLKIIRDKYNAAIIVSHHERKGSAEDAGMNANYKARGSSVIPAAIDFHLHLKRKGSRITIERPKGRGADEDIIFYDILEVDHPDGMALALVAPRPEETRQGALLAYLAEPRQRRDIIALYAGRSDCGNTSARRAKAADNDLRLLHAYNKIERVAHGVWRVRNTRHGSTTTTTTT